MGKGGILKSSLVAGYPALPPACVYTINIAKSSLGFLLSNSQKTSDVEGISRDRQELTGSNGEAAYHTCVVLSRWTPYNDVKDLHDVVEEEEPFVRCDLRGGAVNQGDCLAVKQGDESSLHAAVRTGNAQRFSHSPPADSDGRANRTADSVVTPPIPRQAPPSLQCAEGERQRATANVPLTPLGRIMQDLKRLDAGEFLLLYDTMQRKLNSVAVAAATPLVPFETWGECCVAPCPQLHSEDACIAKQVQRLSLAPSGGGASGGRVFSIAAADSGPGGAGDSDEEFDSVGNEVGEKYFLRDQLSHLYNKGILIDRDGWHEMTIEPIARYMAVVMYTHSHFQRQLELCGCSAPSFPQLCSYHKVGQQATSPKGPERVRPLVAADGCCGLGGDVVQLQQVFDFVVGVDCDILRVALCRHNADLVREHLQQKQRSCCPVMLLHDELQQVAAFRSGWSVRDNQTIRDSVHRLTLRALQDRQAGKNLLLEKLMGRPQWQRQSKANKGVGGSAVGATSSDSAGALKGIASDCTATCSVKGMGRFPHLCVCVPFSSAVCPFCFCAVDHDLTGAYSEQTCTQLDSGPSEAAVDVLPLDWLYISPPWGGRNYKGRRNVTEEVFFPSTASDMVDLVISSAKLSPNVCLFLPRATDLHEILAVASSLRFPLIDVEVLYLPEDKKQQTYKGRKYHLFPKAVVVYLIREVRSWIETRGIPNPHAYEMTKKMRKNTNFTGWRSSEGDPLNCRFCSNGVYIPSTKSVTTSAAKPLFAFCEVKVERKDICDSSPVLGGDRNFPNKASPVSFATFLGHVQTALTALSCSLNSDGGLSLDLIQDIRDGKLDLALAKFDKLLSGASYNRSAEPRH